MKYVFAVLLCALPAHGSMWPDLGEPRDAEPDGANDAAVLVGIGDYAFVTDVPGATQNLDDWYRDLRARAVPIDRIALLRDAQATREDILEAVTRTAAKVAPGGRLWVVFIGHGAPAPDGDGLLVGVDAQQTARSLQSRSVRRSDLLAAADKAPQAVVVLDTCFSGKDPAGSALVRGLQPLVPTRAEVPQGKTIVFTAAAQDQFAGPLPGGNRPAFSYLVLGALRGWGDTNADREITAGEVHRYARSVLDTLVTDRRQTPEMSASRPDFVLAASRGEAGPDLDTIRLQTRGAPVATAAQPRVAPPRTQLRFIAADEDTEFQVAIKTDAGRLNCPGAIDHVSPCVLSNVPTGRARIVVNGDLEHKQLLPVTEGLTMVEIHEKPNWAFWWGGGLTLGGYALMVGGVFGIADGDGTGGTSGTSIAAAAVGVSAAMTGLGLLGWATYKYFSLDGEPLQVEHVPTMSAGIAPLPGGGGVVGLSGTWR